MIEIALLSVFLTGPTFFAVAHVSAARPFAPLVRGSIERSCALAAAGIAAAAIFAAGAALAFAWPWFAGTAAFALSSLLAPPVIGLAPWTAGEVLSGPSIRQELSLAAALGASYLAGALGFALLIPMGWAPALVAAGSASAIVSTAAYLVSRGPAA